MSDEEHKRRLMKREKVDKTDYVGVTADLSRFALPPLPEDWHSFD